MYTNIPTEELNTNIEIVCLNNIKDTLKHNIIKLSSTIIEQNYFQFLDKIYIQPEGLAMGAPTSSMFSEFYLQFLEKSTLYNILLDNDVKGYFRYVDDMLIVYNEDKADIDSLLDCFNHVSPKLKFTAEKETESKINFLDITIIREPSKLSINIYRKPKYTDAIIAADSCHPKEHKMSAIRYLYNRMNSYQLTPAK